MAMQGTIPKVTSSTPRFCSAMTRSLSHSWKKSLVRFSAYAAFDLFCVASLKVGLQVYVFDDADWDKTLELIDTTSEYGLTGSM